MGALHRGERGVLQGPRVVPAAGVLLAILAVAGFALFGRSNQSSKTVADAPGCPDSGRFPADVTPDRTYRAELCLVNAERKSHGLRLLAEQAQLDDAAEATARDIVRRHFFSHVNPDGKAPRARIEAAGYTRSPLTGEDLAWATGSEATPVKIVDGWMHSAEHRRVLLEPRFTEIGIAFELGAPQTGASNAAVYAAEFGAGRR